jgi:outer membrane protein assembly factor BamB
MNPVTGRDWVLRTRRRFAAASILVVLAACGFGGLARASGGLMLTKISPSSGPVGTLVTLTGSGFASGDVVTINGTAESVKSVNQAETSMQVKVTPFTTSGVVSVQDGSTGQRVSLPNAPFTVTTGVYVSPDRAWAGGTITFSGSALSPDQTETIYIAARRVGSVTTDRFGDFKVGVSVPWDVQAGKLSIYVVDPRYRTITTILYVLGAWPEFGHDSAHSGVQTWEPSLTKTSVPGLAVKWRFPTAAAVTGGPAVANGILYVGSQDGTLYARDAGTGKTRWSYATGGPITSTPAVDTNRVFVYSTGGVFYALNATTGALVWKRSIGADSDSSPVTANGIVYVGTNYDGNLYAFNEATGAMLWNFPTSGLLDSPAVSNGIVYVGSHDGHLYAVNATTGAQVWARFTGEIIDSSPTVSGGEVYVGTKAGTLYAVDASTGSVTWSWSSLSASPPDGSPMRSSPAAYGGLVFIADDYGRVYGIDAVTGTRKWTAPIGYDVRSSPAVANGVLYIGTGVDYWQVDALNTSTGAVIWSHATSGELDSSPAVSNGMVYAGSYDQYVYAFGL